MQLIQYFKGKNFSSILSRENQMDFKVTDRSSFADKIIFHNLTLKKLCYSQCTSKLRHSIKEVIQSAEGYKGEAVPTEQYASETI
jgi:hypothetical protein